MLQTIARKCRPTVVADAIKKRCASDPAFVKLVKTFKAKARSENAKQVVKLYVTHEIMKQIKCHALMLDRELVSDTDCACFACLSFVATTKCKCGNHLVCEGCEGYCD
jgi:hypothetical protein